MDFDCHVVSHLVGEIAFLLQLLVNEDSELWLRDLGHHFK